MNRNVDLIYEGANLLSGIFIGAALAKAHRVVPAAGAALVAGLALESIDIRAVSYGLGLGLLGRGLLDLTFMVSGVKKGLSLPKSRLSRLVPIGQMAFGATYSAWGLGKASNSLGEGI